VAVALKRSWVNDQTPFREPFICRLRALACIAVPSRPSRGSNWRKFGA
jgi:hypothetical protein